MPMTLPRTSAELSLKRCFRQFSTCPAASSLAFVIASQRRRRTLVPTGAPRPVRMRRRLVDGRSPGSRVLALRRLPRSPQWHHGEQLAAYSCGGSRGVEPRSLLIPPGNHHGQANRKGRDIQAQTGHSPGLAPVTICSALSALHWKQTGHANGETHRQELPT